MNSFFKEKVISVFLLIILISWIFLLPFHSHEEIKGRSCLNKSCSISSHLGKRLPCTQTNQSLFSYKRDHSQPFNSPESYNNQILSDNCPYCGLTKIFQNIIFFQSTFLIKNSYFDFKCSFEHFKLVSFSFFSSDARAPPFFYRA